MLSMHFRVYTSQFLNPNKGIVHLKSNENIFLKDVYIFIFYFYEYMYYTEGNA